MKAKLKGYDNLTQRQKGLVDAIVLNELEDKEWTAKEIVEVAHEMTGEKKYHPETVYDIKNRYEHIIEERLQVLSNPDNYEEGNIVTIGDPMRKYTGPEGGIDLTEGVGEQSILNRPHKDETTETDETTEAEAEAEDQVSETYLLPATEEIIFKMIRSEDEEVARWAFDQVMDDSN